MKGLFEDNAAFVKDCTFKELRKKVADQYRTAQFTPSPESVRIEGMNADQLFDFIEIDQVQQCLDNGDWVSLTTLCMYLATLEALSDEQ